MWPRHRLLQATKQEHGERRVRRPGEGANYLPYLDTFSRYQIPRHLLATHLLRHAPSPDTSAFIIYPSNFDAFAPRTLLNAVQSADASISKENAIKRLDSVQLLPVQNFSNAVQAIAQVSQLLSEIADRRRQQQQQQHNHPIVLIVVGLATLAEGIIRASNPVKGTALLAATLRNLTRLSRSYASFLSILLVNTNGLGPLSLESDKQTDSNQSKPPEMAADTRSLRDDGIHSIFRSVSPSLLSNILMKTLDQGIDTHILLSDVKVTTVAEVIKDRVGAGVGKWGIWSSKP